MTKTQVLGVIALVLALCSIFVSAYPLLAIAVIVLALAYTL